MSSTSSLRLHEKNPRFEEMLRCMEEKIDILKEEMEQLRVALKETKEDLKMSIKVAISATVHSVCKHPSRSLSDSNVLSVHEERGVDMPLKEVDLREARGSPKSSPSLKVHAVLFNILLLMNNFCV